MDYTLFKNKDNARGQLDSSIGASTLSIPLKSGEGALFPSVYTDSATSAGDANTLNCTGIGSLGVAEGDFIENLTDGSHAFITGVSANSVTTTTLQGGSGNTWDNSDVWAVNRFVITLTKENASTGAVTQYEQVLIDDNSSDILTVNASGRGYAGTTAATFDADDYVNLFVVAKNDEFVKKAIAEMASNVKNLQDTAPSALEKVALARLLDFDLTYSGVSLDVTVGGGIYDSAGNAASDTPLTLTGSSTNYIEINKTTGVISANTTSFNSSTSLALWQVTTDGSGVTTATDKRQNYGDNQGSTTAPTQLVTPFTAGESGNANDALYFGGEESLINLGSPDSSYDIRGDGGTYEEQAQSFQVTADTIVSAVQLRLLKAGSPTDLLTIRIETDNSGYPSGTLVHADAYTTIDSSTLTASYVDYTLVFQGQFTLTASTTYHVVISRADSYDATNRVRIEAKSSGGYASGQLNSKNSGSWASSAPADITFLTFNAVDVRKASTSSSATKKFIGFAKDDYTAGASVDVVTDGVMDGFSGLVSGNVYVLDSTSGAITTGSGTPYTGEIVVGQAVGSTKLKLIPLDFIRSV